MKTKSQIRAEARTIAKKEKVKYQPCSRCGYNIYPIMQLHHIDGVARGGDNSRKNLKVLCPNCHRAVHGGYVSVEPNFNADGGLVRVNIKESTIW